MGAKELLEIIIRPGQRRDSIAVKKARPVTPRDFEEVSQRWSQCSSGGLMAGQRAEQTAETALDSIARAL
jgi:hypothetical protein